MGIALVLTQSYETVCFGGSEREKGQINTREYNAKTVKSLTPGLSEEHKRLNPLVEFPKPAKQRKVKG